MFIMRLQIINFFLVVGVLASERSVEENLERKRQARQAGGGLNCPIGLPQKSTDKCRAIREKDLEVQRGIYQMALRKPLPMPLVNMNKSTLIQVLKQDEFAKDQFNGYAGMLRKNRDFSKTWKKKHPKEITELQDYAKIFNDFRSELGENGSTGLYRFVTNVEPFQDILKDWRKDDMFTEQRLSGCNPMVLRRVTEDSCRFNLSP